MVLFLLYCCLSLLVPCRAFIGTHSGGANHFLENTVTQVPERNPDLRDGVEVHQAGND
jgi:hypothetical protein